MPQETFEIKIVHKTRDEFEREWKNSYSKGQVFTHPEKKPAGRAKVKLTVEIKETCGKVVFTGEVVHASEHGVGLQLDPITDAVKHAVQNALDAMPFCEDEEDMPEVDLEPDTNGDKADDDDWEDDGETVAEETENAGEEQEEVVEEKSEASEKEGKAGGEKGATVKDAPEEGGSEAEKSVFIRVQTMNRNDRAALGRKGTMEERNVLIRDKDPYVIFAVLQNPRITIPEIVSLTKSHGITLEMIKIILNKQEWMAVEEVRLNIVLNPKTPLPTATGLLKKLSDKNIRTIAKKPLKQALKSAALKIVIDKGGK